MPLNIKRPRKKVPFYEDRAAGMQVTAAQKALDEAQAADDRDRRMSSKGPAKERKHLEEVTAAAEATVLDLTLEALPRKRWAEALEAHPARPGDASDKAFNLNIDTFLAEVLGESVVEARQRGTGELRTDVTPADWTGAVAELDDGQYSALLLAILDLNRSAANPF